MPHNCGDFSLWSTRRVKLNDFTWLVYIIESPYRNIGAWHDLITLQILPRINIKVQYIKYTSEYIPKLQTHQQNGPSTLCKGSISYHSRHLFHTLWNFLLDSLLKWPFKTSISLFLLYPLKGWIMVQLHPIVESLILHLHTYKFP